MCTVHAICFDQFPHLCLEIFYLAYDGSRWYIDRYSHVSVNNIKILSVINILLTYWKIIYNHIFTMYTRTLGDANIYTGQQNWRWQWCYFWK